ncbi:MAG: T9SS type A sorting domain-containing protein [Flavobacteriales bacterium]
MYRPITFALFFLCGTALVAQISALYPGDAGIGSDPRVLFTEQFENSLPVIQGNYDDVMNAAGMSLDTDVPPGSAGLHSIRITNMGGQNNGGHLYKRFTPGWDSTIYVRYYVKYPQTSQGYIHHESVWVGGYNPMLPYPYPRAGDCGLGDARISIAYEPITNAMNTYMYWGEMHNDPNGDCWGNVLIKGDSVARPVPFDQWLCVEMMIKLNDPDTAHNGELRIWHNSEEVGYWGPGFPTGHWLWDKFYITAGEAPFQGFRWRTDAALNLNYLWIEYYDDTSPAGISHHILYDHLVVATERIGPLEPATAVVEQHEPERLQCIIDPSDHLIVRVPPGIEHGDLRIVDAAGRVIVQHTISSGTMDMDLDRFAPGVYTCEVFNANGQLSARFAKAW